jgi:hypothetical protein
MGRGLSDHQKAVLVLALGHRRDGKKGADLSHLEIRRVLYGLGANQSGRRWPYWTTPKSRSADVAITVMVHGLRRRGLIRRVRIRTAGRAALVLTAAGLDLAERLPSLQTILQKLSWTKLPPGTQQELFGAKMPPRRKTRR